MPYPGLDEKWLDERMRRLGHTVPLAIPLPELPRKVALVLPWPPSLNHNIGKTTSSGRMIFFLSPEHRVFRRDVCKIIAAGAFKPLRGSLRLTLEIFPPDRRKRDISNLIKPIEDALQAAGLFKNDEQIDSIHVDRVRTPVAGGHVLATVEQIA